MNTVLITTGLFRIIVCLAGLYWTSRALGILPLPARFAIGGMVLFLAQAVVVTAIGFGADTDFLKASASALAASAVCLVVAVFALTAPD